MHISVHLFKQVVSWLTHYEPHTRDKKRHQTMKTRQMIISILVHCSVIGKKIGVIRISKYMYNIERPLDINVTKMRPRHSILRLNCTLCDNYIMELVKQCKACYVILETRQDKMSQHIQKKSRREKIVSALFDWKRI